MKDKKRIVYFELILGTILGVFVLFWLLFWSVVDNTPSAILGLLFLVCFAYCFGQL